MFPLSISHEQLLNETSGTLPRLHREAEALLIGQGAEIVEKTSTRVRFCAPFLFGPGSVYPSSLFLVDDGSVELEPASGGVRVRYWLSTKRMAFLWFLLCAGIGAVAGIAIPSGWPLPVSLVAWVWVFGFNYLAQRMRAETLFGGLRGTVT